MKNLVRPVTADELLRMPDNGVRRELIRGEVREMPPPGEEHGWVTGKIHAILGNFILERKLGRFLTAETGFLLERDPDTVRAPDFAFTRAARLRGPATKKHSSVPPDLVVETLSPDDRPGYVAGKVADWLRFGVRLVWVLDPDRRTVTVHRPGADPRVLQQGESLDGGDVVPGFRVAVAGLWD